MSGSSRQRDAVRVLLLDEDERLLLFQAVDPESGEAFWFAPGGGLEDGEEVHAAAAREVAEETGLTGVLLGPEVWRRRHVFRWRGIEWDQRERWFVARVARFDPVPSALTDVEQQDLTAWRWWSIAELRAATDRLVPGDLAEQLSSLLADGPPPSPVDIGV